MRTSFHKDNFQEIFNVSRETLTSLLIYKELLENFSPKLNIIGKGTVPNIWQRHLADSAKLYVILENLYLKTPSIKQRVCDVGSGAGLPGIVLAIMNNEKQLPLEFTLIESSKKKAAFISNAVKELKIASVVINKRAEDLVDKYDIILARAVAALPKLMECCVKISKKETVYIFPKGKTWVNELDQLKKKWHYKLNIVKNSKLIDESGGVTLVLSNVKKKNE